MFKGLLCSGKSAVVEERLSTRSRAAANHSQEEKLPAYTYDESKDSGLLQTMESTVDSLSKDLRKVSLDIHDHPQIGWGTILAHDTCVEFMRKQKGWKVTPHAYGLKAGWEAKFSHKSGGRTIGFNSEMDALPEVGHACGHNLIAISGIGAAIATAAALVKHDIPGKVILLGTPFEEGGGGKVVMIKAGAYKPMDACMMLHPGPMAYSGLSPMIAISSATVEYHGKGAHAAGAPWQGVNALDAAVQAYNSVAMLRQQCPPATRIHGLIQMKEDQPINIIPDYCKATFAFRCSTFKELEALREKLQNCWDAARLSTGTTMKVTWKFSYKDVIHNPALGQVYTEYMKDRQKIVLHENLPSLGSTDFGDVSYEVPAIHPIFGIETGGDNNGNHTVGFTRAARTEEAHLETLKATKGIAAVALKFITDDGFAKQVKDDFRKV